MKVHVVNISLRDCEAVTFANHDKCWLEGDIDKHFKAIGESSLEEYKPSRHDMFILTTLELQNTDEHVTHREVTVEELRAFLNS